MAGAFFAACLTGILSTGALFLRYSSPLWLRVCSVGKIVAAAAYFLAVWRHGPRYAVMRIWAFPHHALYLSLTCACVILAGQQQHGRSTVAFASSVTMSAAMCFCDMLMGSCALFTLDRAESHIVPLLWASCVRSLRFVDALSDMLTAKAGWQQVRCFWHAGTNSASVQQASSTSSGQHCVSANVCVAIGAGLHICKLSCWPECPEDTQDRW
jgi:hypothetical protein